MYPSQHSSFSKGKKKVGRSLLGGLVRPVCRECMCTPFQINDSLQKGCISSMAPLLWGVLTSEFTSHSKDVADSSIKDAIDR